MKSVVIYDSTYGNTQKIAEAIAEELRTAGTVEIENVHDAALTLPSDAGFLVVGGPTQYHGVSRRLRTQLDALPKQSLTGLTAEAFDTRARGLRILTGSASTGIARSLRSKGATLIGEPQSFEVEGTQGPLAAGEIERARKWAQAVIGEVAAKVVAAG